MAYNPAMRFDRAFAHWLLASLPLLALMLALALAFGSERAAAEAFHAHRAQYPGLATALSWMTDLIVWGFYAAWLGLLIQGLRQGDKARIRLVLAYVAVQIIVSLALVRVLKMAIGRPRPGQGAWFEPMTGHGTHHSMPSGHTTDVAVSALPLAMVWQRAAFSLLLGLLLGLEGFSRIYLGWHHPTDVFFGWLLGSVGALAVELFAGRAARG